MQPGDRLIADANTGWLMHDALRVVRAVRDVDVYIEQPCRTYEECLTIRRHCDHPFVLDENIDSLDVLLRGHADRAMDVVNIKISKFGGLTKARQARDLCVSLGIAMTIEDSWGGDIVTAAIAHLAHSTPREFLFTTTDFNSYVTVSFADGRSAPRQRPDGRRSAAGPGNHAEDGRAGEAGGGGKVGLACRAGPHAHFAAPNVVESNSSGRPCPHPTESAKIVFTNVYRTAFSKGGGDGVVSWPITTPDLLCRNSHVAWLLRAGRGRALQSASLSRWMSFPFSPGWDATPGPVTAKRAGRMGFSSRCWVLSRFRLCGPDAGSPRSPSFSCRRPRQASC